MAGRPILRRTCAQPVLLRALPETEIPRALHVDVYCPLFRVFLRGGHPVRAFCQSCGRGIKERREKEAACKGGRAEGKMEQAGMLD